MSSNSHEHGAPDEHPPHPEDAAGHAHHGHHSPYLHHHFETPGQQFESDKFGMWLFLATEILLFGGLFCAYSIYRANHPEVFDYAHQFLDWKMGGLNTLVLIFSSFTMAWGVRAAQLGQRTLLVSLLAITIVCGAAFMVIKYFEYSHKLHEGLTWGGTYSYDPAGHGHGHDAAHGGEEAEHGSAIEEPASAVHSDDPPLVAESDERHMSPMPIVDPLIGESSDPPALSEMQAESVIPGVSMEASDEGAQRAEEQHADRSADDGDVPADATDHSGELPPAVETVPPPAGAAGGAQPAAISETHAAAAEALPAAPAGVATTHSTIAAPGTLPALAATPILPESLALEPTRVPPAAQAPAGLSAGPRVTEGHHAEDVPRNVQMFFSIYFAMTGLHGIHVLIGMLVIGIMMVKAAKGHYTAEYWTPIDLTGLYWHVVDLIWIFLFPLLYLI